MTNYENSKKLHKLGFDKDNSSIFGWFSKPAISPMEMVGRFIIADGIKEGFNFDFYSFDLETILDALPKNIKKENDFSAKLKIFFDENGENIDGTAYIGYQNFQGFIDEYTKEQGIDETLTDTAARLLIKLHEEKIINFNKEKK